MDRHFFRAQQILKNRKAGGDVKGGAAVRPLFKPELADLNPKGNLKRLHDYQNKLAGMEAA